MFSSRAELKNQSNQRNGLFYFPVRVLTNYSNTAFINIATNVEKFHV